MMEMHLTFLFMHNMKILLRVIFYEDGSGALASYVGTQWFRALNYCIDLQIMKQTSTYGHWSVLFVGLFD